MKSVPGPRFVYIRCEVGYMSKLDKNFHVNSILKITKMLILFRLPETFLVKSVVTSVVSVIPVVFCSECVRADIHTQSWHCTSHLWRSHLLSLTITVLCNTSYVYSVHVWVRKAPLQLNGGFVSERRLANLCRMYRWRLEPVRHVKLVLFFCTAGRACRSTEPSCMVSTKEGLYCLISDTSPRIPWQIYLRECMASEVSPWSYS